MTLTVTPLDNRTQFRLRPLSDDRGPNELVLHAFSPDRQGRVRHISLAPKCGTFVSTRTRVDSLASLQKMETWPDLLKRHVHAAGYYITPEEELEIYLVSSWHDTVFLRHGDPIATLIFSETLDVADPTEHPRTVHP